jgi:hypothetical protein
LIEKHPVHHGSSLIALNLLELIANAGCSKGCLLPVRNLFGGNMSLCSAEGDLTNAGKQAQMQGGGYTYRGENATPPAGNVERSTWERARQERQHKSNP